MTGDEVGDGPEDGEFGEFVNGFEFGQPGIHVRITQLTAQTEPIFEHLLAARVEGGPFASLAPSPPIVHAVMPAAAAMDQECSRDQKRSRHDHVLCERPSHAVRSTAFFTTAARAAAFPRPQ